jgi:hypothetical protein
MMTNDNVYIYDHLTGKEIVREMTDKEQAERNAEIAANIAKKQAETIEAEAVAMAKTEAATKLVALGIDPKALGL